MTYPGGKAGAGVYQTIINQMPPHRVYIEPFLGGGAVLRNKRPAQVNIGIDADEHVALARSGDVPGATVIHGDALEFLYSYQFKGDELVYLDPPYLLSTRRSQRPIYKCELTTEEQHAELMVIVLGLNCMVMISGYWSKLYANMLSDWRSITYKAMTRGGGVATEWLWMNYPEPVALHDYSFLGSNFRERERIKRKSNRWLRKFQALPAQELHAITWALERVRARPSSEVAMEPGSRVHP